MPSDPLHGRCYCGAVHVTARSQPLTGAYCHCSDCRRLSGAPVSAFAAFAPEQLDWSPALQEGVSHSEGVRRWFCQACGTQLAAHYAYLPDQVYLPIGLFEDAATLVPESHSHAGSRLPWLHLSDDLPRAEASNRDRWTEAGG